jgi:hypothetical protein
VLSLALDFIDGFKSFRIDDICSVVEQFYHEDFNQVEIGDLRR